MKIKSEVFLMTGGSVTGEVFCLCVPNFEHLNQLKLPVDFFFYETEDARDSGFQQLKVIDNLTDKNQITSKIFDLTADEANNSINESFVYGLSRAYFDSLWADAFDQTVISSLSTPPESKTIGNRYLIIATATGEWTGKENDIAHWNAAASWDYKNPFEGMRIEDNGVTKTYTGGAWV